MIKNVVFDMGQVLLKFDRDFFIERLGVSPEDKPILMREVFLSLEWGQMDRGSLTDEQAAEIICRRVPEHLHHAVRALVGMWDRPILPIPGMAEYIRELKERGYNIYLLSNTSYRQRDYWERIPGHEYFDGVLLSCDVKRVKPEHEIYEILFAKFNLVPSECVFIDDAIQNVEGSVWAGMPAIVFHGDVAELREKLEPMLAE